MKFWLQNIALWYHNELDISKQDHRVWSARFLDIDWKAISYAPNDITIPWIRNQVYSFIQAINYDSQEQKFVEDITLLENLDKIRLINKYLKKILRQFNFIFRDKHSSVDFVKTNTLENIMGIVHNKQFLLEVNKDNLDEILSWIYDIWKKHPWVLNSSELKELENYTKWMKVENMSFWIIDKRYLINRIKHVLTEMNNFSVINADKAGTGDRIKVWTWVKKISWTVGKILLRTDWTWTMIKQEIEENHFFTTTSLSELAIDRVLRS